MAADDLRRQRHGAARRDAADRRPAHRRGRLSGAYRTPTTCLPGTNCEPCLPMPGRLGTTQRHRRATRRTKRRRPQRAAGHADTPTTAHFDALGRPFLTVARNRVSAVRPRPRRHRRELRHPRRVGHRRQPARSARRTQCRCRATGRLRAAASSCATPTTCSATASTSSAWKLARAGCSNDVAGKPIRAWDSRGHNFTTRYDALRRPTEQYVRGTFSDFDPLKPNSDPRTLNPPNAIGRLVDKIEYGEPPPGATPAEETEAQRLNLRTRIYRHLDSAGEIVNAATKPGGTEREAYDFKGNLRAQHRAAWRGRTRAIPDWSQDQRPQLDADERFESSTRYDALNRPTQSVAPHSSVPRGTLEQVQHHPAGVQRGQPAGAGGRLAGAAGRPCRHARPGQTPIRSASPTSTTTPRASEPSSTTRPETARSSGPPTPTTPRPSD